MLKYLLLFCCLLSTTVCWGQKRIQKIIDKELDLVAISNSLYAEKFEVSKRNYRNFQAHLRIDSSETIMEFTYPYPKSLDWELYDSNILFTEYMKQDGLSYHYSSQKFNSYFFSINSFFSQHPIVGVAHEQAKLYCQWKSKEVTQNVNNWLKKKGFNRRLQFKYHLPTKEEWLLAFGEKESYNKQIKYNKYTLKTLKELGFKNVKDNTYYDLTINQKIIFDHDSLILYERGVNFIGSIYNHSPNQSGLYNMKGNVAEMIDEVGIAMGGSWRDTIEEIDVNLSQNYICPSEWLGFRVFCEIKEVNNDKIIEEDYKINYNSTCEYIYQRNDLNNPKYYEPEYQVHAMDSLYKISNYDSLKISKLDDKYISRIGDKIKLDFGQCYDTIYLGFTRYYSRFFVRRCNRSSTFINTNSVEFSKSNFKNTLFGIFIILYVDDKKTIKYIVIDNRIQKQD